jgi:hypothetical protein
MIKKIFFVLAFISLLVLLPPLIQAQSKSLYIPAYAFLSRDDDPDWAWACKSGYIYPKDTGYGCRVGAPVHLPDGANITKIVIRYWFPEPPEGVSRGISVTMYRRNLYTNEQQQMAYMSPYHGGPSWQTFERTNVSKPIISNSGYSYYLHISISGQGDVIRLAGVKILYIEK